MAQINRQITLAARPAGYPKESDFKLVESPIPSPGPGQVLVRVLYLSVDPYMRGRMNDVRTYADPVKIGEVMGGGTVGRVVESRNDQFNEGDFVAGMQGWQEYGLSDGKDLRKLDPSLAPITTALGVLGMPGLTAYFGLLDICNPQPGETVVVSGAAGAVGSLAGQIAKIKGCRVVGIAGSDDKVRHLTDDLGFDAAFNYKTTSDYYGKLKQLCPSGIDVYFDNVGGEITDAVFRLINVRARISICGQISQYNVEKPEMGPRLLLTMLLIRQAKAEGFLVFQFAERYPEGIREMARWIKEGKLKYREDVVEGLETTPRAFIGMLKGENIGKRLVKVANP
jgi:leukotriene B4 12-hydroxydehydrogenase/15-oxo-prostaglandin 13-reductase